MGRTKRPTTLNGDFSPLTRAVVKRAVQLYDMSKEAVAEAGERLQGLIAEARAEMGNGEPSKSDKKNRKKKR